LLLAALRSFYIALSLFSASALVALLGAAFTVGSAHLGIVLAEFVALPLGAIAVGGQILSCALLRRESNLAILNVSENAKILRERCGDADV
jgi:hypothetical protein